MPGKAFSVCIKDSVFIEPKFSTESFVKDLHKYKPSMTLTATSLWIYATNARELENVDFSSMKYPITGGEKFLPKDEMRLASFLDRHECKEAMIKGYGMCELGGTVSTSSHAVEYLGKLGGAGAPILNVTVSAFDLNTGKELPYGQHGELRVLSPARMKEYYKNPDATAEFFKTDEFGNVWGCTGDIGYIDEDGEVFVLGRATDSYRREDGEVVYLFDIEDLVLEENCVDQCKVVDVDINGTTVLVAHVVFENDIVDAESILKRINFNLKNKLPDYKTPSYYKIRQSMPVHSNGKRDIETLRNDRENLISAGQLE